MKPLLTTELEHAVEEALTPERPCEGRQEHTEPAIWWAIRCCGCPVTAYCETCHDWTVAHAGQIDCTTCGFLEVIVRFEAIQ